MKSLKTFFVLAILMASAIFTLVSATPSEEELFLMAETQEKEATSLRGTSRFLAQKDSRAVKTCDKYPLVCDAKGSVVPHCCQKKCVNVTTDRLNCGSCGKKCSYSKICCQGKCVSPMSNEKHCGSCGNNCKKGGFCAYGMCSYA
ncbi:stigma-specific STIG1-like protein 3 [Alnus glutinosa]|uniref:stigma-specific STIG1-like protein 3 n=1 Tax=Alnus glutinosa TaxID=3517 RepID=UPI002D773448|nr:stigma-specific STIG1-like protein 3 [Alnus glutinosa]